LVTIGERPTLMIEVKWAEGGLSRSLPVFARYLPGVRGVQFVGELEREKSFESGLRIVRAAPWLADLDLRPQGSSHRGRSQRNLKGIAGGPVLAFPCVPWTADEPTSKTWRRPAPIMVVPVQSDGGSGHASSSRHHNK